MRIEITSEGFVSYRGKLYPAGTELEVSVQEGESLVDRGLAVQKNRKLSKVDDSESEAVDLPPVDLEKTVTARSRTTKKKA